MKRIGLGVCIFAMLFFITGCGKNKLVGKWAIEKSPEYHYVFNEDKTCSYEMTGARMECTYEDDGTKVSILYRGNDKSKVFEYKIEDNILIIEDDFGNDVRYIRIEE